MKTSKRKVKRASLKVIGRINRAYRHGSGLTRIENRVIPTIETANERICPGCKTPIDVNGYCQCGNPVMTPSERASLEQLTRPEPRALSLTGEVKSLFSSADVALTLARAIRFKLVGVGEAAPPTSSQPVSLQAWIRHADETIANVNRLLEELNSLIEAEA